MSYRATPYRDRDVLCVMAAEAEYGPRLRRLVSAFITGVGPVEAALSLGRELERRRHRGAPPDLVLSLGSAWSRAHEVGTVCEVSSVTWRDMDATPLGFPPGVTPFLGLPATIPLPARIPGLPRASLSTGAKVVTGDGSADGVTTELADMETYAVLRTCQSFGLPLAAIRGVSDGPGGLGAVGDWTSVLGRLDAELAKAVERLLALTPDG